MWRRGEYEEHTVQGAAKLCAELCLIFGDAGIPVIRLGLNPTDTLSAGDAAAGAYHPAFGELVYSRICYDKASELLEGAAPGSNAVITVYKGFLSMMTGRRRENIHALIDRFSLNSLKVVESGNKDKSISPQSCIQSCFTD
jgi:hypothetical protein